MFGYYAAHAHLRCRRSRRNARRRDGMRCHYAPYVEQTAVTFETEPPAAVEMADRIASARATHAWLVATINGRVVGYAYAHAFSARKAYDWSCEVSIYLEMGFRRTGTGRTLYHHLLRRLAARGYRVAVALIALPNEASIGLHKAFGFEDVRSGETSAGNTVPGMIAFAQFAITNGVGPPDAIDRPA